MKGMRMFDAKKCGIELPDSENPHTITVLEVARETGESPLRGVGHVRKEKNGDSSSS